ncbi:BTAD domain-containing putative transcriptional regulator [Nonomuraea sp. NPDC050404]|uniref:AfsR/SARP family transcriptional regulator n=1 Tax=Nonomuraea sp. NPDC050404 TaxID=3155783 RepID=UPI0033E2E857
MPINDSDLAFDLLGPFGVHARGRTVTVSSPKHRALLAALLLQAGSPVSNNELAVAIWGSDQPEAPRRAVQLIVARLRALLGTGVIVTCADGYLVDVRPERIDLGRFRYWVKQAEQAARRPDPAMEAAALTEALSQWKGEPLADVHSDFLRHHVARLVEQRLQAVERRFDAHLRIGRHQDVVAELLEVTGQYPLRERFWTQLMTALHRCGRRADALTAFHTGRRHLVEELGIDPGQEMRRLHALILNHPQGEPGLPAVPRQLPPAVSAFAGRRREITGLDALMPGGEGDPRPTVVISGTAGVGKTTLALHWSRRMVDHFPDGQLWVNLRGYDHRPVMSPQRALRLFLRALGVPERALPADLDGQSALYRSLMDGRRALIVLDNAYSSEQVRPLLPGSPCNTVIVTSRTRLTGLMAANGAHNLALDLFGDRDSLELLANRFGAHRINAEPVAAQLIVNRCARLPLALAVAAARVVQQPAQSLRALANRLNAARSSLDEFADADLATDLRAAFSWSYRTLSEPAARLFRLIGEQPGTELTAPAMARLSAVTLAEVIPLLDELTSAHLATEHTAGRYRLHALLHAYAIELARSHQVVHVPQMTG